MNKLFKSSLVLLVVLLCSLAGSAQHYIVTRPGRPAVAVRRPPSPGRGAIWIDEDWRWANGRYGWSGGHWARPPYFGARWIPGRWVKARRGWQWMPGRWVRR